MQTLAAVGNLIASFFLYSITWLYVITNQDTLRLMREQWSETRHVYLQFGMTAEDGKAVVWVANLGMTHFMISEVKVRTQSTSLALAQHSIVAPGHIARVVVSHRILEGLHLTGDLDVLLYYHGPGKLTGSGDPTSIQGYNLILSSGSRVENVREGFHELRTITCTKCRIPSPFLMRPDGLSNEDDVKNRVKEVEEELSLNCPAHASKWLMREAPVASP